MHYEYKTEYTCSQLITFDINDGIVTNVEFFGGCNGNLKAIPLLVNGMSADEIASKIAGVLCGRRPTSCGDQLARAVMLAKAEEQKMKEN